MRPLVAVTMPVYNGESHLPTAIASLLGQTHSHWKCYIVNDGSVDSTREILDRLVDSRFSVIHLDENKGRPYARQVALEAAEGRYLAFLDADDIYHPEKLERQVAIMEKYPEIDLVSCVMASFDRSFILRTVRPRRAASILTYTKEDLFQPSRAGSMLRLEIAKQYQYDNLLRFAQDTDFLTRYLDGRGYMVLNEVLYYYSEFSSVTWQKIIRTNYYEILKEVKILKNAPAKMMLSVSKRLGKLILITLLLPFIGTHGILKNRGTEPKQVELEDFEKTMMVVKQNMD